MSSNKFNKISKYIKIAYLRWQQYCNSLQEVSEEAIACCEFIVYVSQMAKSESDLTLKDVVEKVFNNIFNDFKTRQNREYEAAKKFIECQYLDKSEAQEHLKKIEEKLADDLQKFLNQIRRALDLFDFSLDIDLQVNENKEKYLSVVSDLKRLGYDCFVAEEISCILAKNKGIGFYSQKKLSEGFDIVTNGTFFWPGTILGSIISDDCETFECDNALTNMRGCVAIQESGLVRVDYTDSNKIENIKKSFFINKNTEGPYIDEIMNDDALHSVIAGGLLLIRNSKAVSGAEIYEKQQFLHTMDGSKNGLKAEQLRKTKHVIIGIWNYVPFIAVPSKNSSKGEEIQNDFLKLKFSELVKFDGGSEFFFDSQKYWQHLTGKNSPSGFAIKVREL